MDQPVNFCFVGNGEIHHRIRGRVVRIATGGIVIEDPHQTHRTALPPRVFRSMVIDHCDCSAR